jgi:hypothetical protein
LAIARVCGCATAALGLGFVLAGLELQVLTLNSVPDK